jgi:hypothetical protein
LPDISDNEKQPFGKRTATLIEKRKQKKNEGIMNNEVEWIMETVEEEGRRKTDGFFNYEEMESLVTWDIPFYRSQTSRFL